MKQTVKEKLNDKSRKMIDLIYDEVVDGGEKEFSASFIDYKNSQKCILSVKIQVTDINDIPYELPDTITDFETDDDL